MAQGRGKKINPTKNHRAHEEWTLGKKLGRRKQQWVWDLDLKSDTPLPDQQEGHWEKI